MKILHSSNIHLGKSFAGQTSGGEKLRAAIKATFSRLIDLALAEKVDLVILAGDTFDSIDVSQNLLNFFISEVQRLEKKPLAILPGLRDSYQKGSFWEEWEVTPPAGNLLLLTSQEKPSIELPGLSATIYGYPILSESSPDNPATKIKRFGKSSHHIAVIYGNLSYGKTASPAKLSFRTDDIISGGFDYAALGGQRSTHDFSYIGLKAAYPGSPEILSWERENAGQVLIVTTGGGKISLEPRKISCLEWREAAISMDMVSNQDELKQKIFEMSGPEVFLRVTLEGLALFEAGLDIEQLQKELEGNFLSLEFKDQTRVLPDNISAVKVHEKTILGQYLRIMVDKLNAADGPAREDLEESLKVGYTLLTGKEIW